MLTDPYNLNRPFQDFMFGFTSEGVTQIMKSCECSTKQFINEVHLQAFPSIFNNSTWSSSAEQGRVCSIVIFELSITDIKWTELDCFVNN